MPKDLRELTEILKRLAGLIEDLQDYLDYPALLKWSEWPPSQLEGGDFHQIDSLVTENLDHLNPSKSVLVLTDHPELFESLKSRGFMASESSTCSQALVAQYDIDFDALQRHLTPDAKVIFRCIPWTSRWAAGIYKVCNKAYMHLYLAPQDFETYIREFQEIPEGFELPCTRPSRPIQYFNRLLSDNGYRIVSKPTVVKRPIEPFFNDQMLNRMAFNIWGEDKPDFDIVTSILRTCSLTYVTIADAEGRI